MKLKDDLTWEDAVLRARHFYRENVPAAGKGCASVRHISREIKEGKAAYTTVTKQTTLQNRFARRRAPTLLWLSASVSATRSLSGT